MDTVTWEAFKEWDDGRIAELVRTQNYPRLGVYIPDGTRRLTLALSTCPAEGLAFYQTAVNIAEELLLRRLEDFFNTGLWGLVLPLFSRQVLQRSEAYFRYFAMPALQRLTQAPLWLSFYERYDVQVYFYGLQGLLGTNFGTELQAWAETLQRVTAVHQGHILCLGVGGSSVLGEDSLMVSGAPDLQACRRAFYGLDLPSADFALMTGQFGGLGALPLFLCDGKTALYVMPAPGLLLSAHGWRKILYDLLFQRRGQEVYPFSLEERLALRHLYQQGAELILGLGERLNGVWIARELQDAETTSSFRPAGDQK